MNRELGKEGLNKINKEFSEIKERGNEISNEGENVASAFKGMNTEGLDPDDINAVETSRAGYDKAFNAEVQESITEPTAEVNSKAESDVSSLENDKNRVTDLKEKFDNISGMSEIGSENSDRAASKMEQSASEYSGIIGGFKEAMDKSKEESQKLRDKMGSLFN